MGNEFQWNICGIYFVVDNDVSREDLNFDSISWLSVSLPLEAHSVLSQCAGRRDTLLKSIDEVTKDIQTKRSQLAATREELRELSMQEGQVKQRRDLASQKCSDLRRNVRACRETVQQLHSLYGKKRKGGEKAFKARTAET